MTDFLNLLDAQMTTPKPYGAFHLCALAIVIVTAALISHFGRNAKDRSFRAVCFVFWALYFLFETYKQINFSFNYNGGEPYWDYQWYAFPFQLCSAPLYVLPFVFLTRDGSPVRRAAVAFMSTYVLFAGAAVMLYPSTVFIGTIGINIQTMFWHGSQVILGCFFLTRHRNELGARYFLSGAVFFLAMLCVAVALDLIVPRFTDETFNMYFISPLFPSSLPVLSGIWPVVPWGVFIAIYVFGFSLAAALTLLAAIGIRTLAERKKKLA